MQLMDVTPTILRVFGIDAPADLQGNVIEALFQAERALH
jgi:arylsulfatase A-like enzyme